MHLITIIISATQTRVVINVNIIIAAQILQLQKPAAYLLLCPLPILLLNPKKKCNYTFYVKLKSTFFKPPYFQGTVLPPAPNFKQTHYLTQLGTKALLIEERLEKQLQ